MTGAFAAALGALFADPNLAREAVYAPDGGAPRPVRATARRADAVAEFGGARLWSETVRIDLRVAEVAAPRPGDRVEMDGEAFRVEGEPVRDRERLTWTLELRPAGAARGPQVIEGGDRALVVAAGATLAGEAVVGGDGMLEVAA